MRRHLRSLLRTGFAMFVLGASLTAARPALAQSTNHVISIEEHWELQVSSPDSDRSAPQTTMVMSPTGDLSGVHFLFTLNHSTVPNYQPGGMQVQVWDGEDLADESVGSDSAALEHANETVRWVQKMSLENGHLKFQVINGESETWSSFGGDDLSVSVETNLNKLNFYRPAVSLGESQVGYAENRVTSLVLTKLVWVTEDGEVHEQNAPIPIDTSLDN
jgi:hypothetical protein